MGKPAARIGDMHVCPMMTPGVPPIPHVGGPVAMSGAPTVLIGGMPAAVMGDMCTCVGPPDTIILGSTGVFLNKKPAARMGDSCAHGGTIVLGCPTVLIGEAGGGGGGGIAAMPVNVIVDLMGTMPAAVRSKMNQIAAFKVAANGGLPLVQNVDNCHKCSENPPKDVSPDAGLGNMSVPMLKKLMVKMPPKTKQDMNQIAAMKTAADGGMPLVADTDKCPECGDAANNDTAADDRSNSTANSASQ